MTEPTSSPQPEAPQVPVPATRKATPEEINEHLTRVNHMLAVKTKTIERQAIQIAALEERISDLAIRLENTVNELNKFILADREKTGKTPISAAIEKLSG